MQAVEELLSKALEQRSVPETGSSSGGGGDGGGGDGGGGGGPAAADAAIHALEAQIKAEGESLREEISDLRCGNVLSCAILYSKLPRQARDKHKEKH